jgi:glutamate synthase (NADPH/NADH)
VIDTTFPVAAGPEGLRVALEIIAAEAEAAIDAGYQFIVLSDRAAGSERVAVSSLLALGRVHQHLVQVKKRSSVGLLVESGEAREVQQFATLLGYGADAVCPYLAYDTLYALQVSGAACAAAAAAAAACCRGMNLQMIPHC